MRRSAALHATLSLSLSLSATAAIAADASGVVPAPSAGVATPTAATQPVVTVAPPAAGASSVSAADPLPPMNFYASIAGTEIYDRIRATPPFGRVDRELPGSPIVLRVTHTLRPTAGGQAAGLLSAIWAGGTLGLLPVVTSNEFVLSYEVLVNGREVLRYDFQRTLTRASNIWANRNDPTYGLGKDGLEWALATVADFTTRATQDPALLALAREYSFFFGAARP